VSEQKISDGSEVTIRFRLSLEDGTVVESTEGEEPLSFTLGDGTMIEALEEVIKDLTVGERHTYLLGPEEAFGYPDEENIHQMPRSEFPDSIHLEEGQIIAFTTPTGEEVPGAILEIGADTVKVDFNHPLAGRNLAFDVELLAAKSPE
jgi:FKBP-type peptidyl-prolyl cis-trans isomerase SlpA